MISVYRQLCIPQVEGLLVRVSVTSGLSSGAFAARLIRSSMGADDRKNNDAGKASCERVLFSERKQVISMLERMAKPDSDVAGG